MNRLSQVSFGGIILALVLLVSIPAIAAETKGKIKSVDSTKNEFVFTDSTAKDWTFQLNKECKVMINDKEDKLSEVKVGDEATVIYEKKDDKLMATEVKVTRK